MKEHLEGLLEFLVARRRSGNCDEELNPEVWLDFDQSRRQTSTDVFENLYLFLVSVDWKLGLEESAEVKKDVLADHNAEGLLGEAAQMFVSASAALMMQPECPSGFSKICISILTSSNSFSF